jgi:Flp pilus assembly protein TadB
MAEAEYDEAAAGRAAMWTYIWVMVGFKIVTACFVLYFTHAFGFWAIMIALHIPWIAAALILAGAPSAAYWRLVKMRRRRAELIRQEFEVPPEQELRDPLAA